MNTINRLTHYLVIHSATTHIQSLYHGRMGIAIALMMYARHRNKPFLYDYAEHLFYNVCDNISYNMPPGIANGLAGIGYGIMLLHKKGFIDGNLDEILVDIDSQLMKYDPKRYDDFSFRTGLCGIKFYIDTRCEYSKRPIAFDQIFEREVSMALENNKEKCEYYTHILDDISAPTWNIEEYNNKELGINAGCAYYIIKDVYDEILSD